MNKILVDSQWLQNNLNNEDLIILDASLESSKNSVVSHSANKRIKGARFFDLVKSFSDTTSIFPNTVPNPIAFEKGCRDLGINKTSQIIIYDTTGIYSSPRAWWLFKVMGHENVYVLDGGLPDWIKQGYAIEKITNTNFIPGNFEANYQHGLVKDHQFIQSNLDAQNTIVIDARSKGRFDGTDPEPRRGLRSGHIPNSLNLPFSAVLENGKFKSKPLLHKVFQELGLDERPLVFSCGSGLTACIILMASELVSDNKTAVYDGSWTEWVQMNP